MPTDWSGTKTMMPPVERRKRREPLLSRREWLAAGLLIAAAPIVGLLLALAALQVAL